MTNLMFASSLLILFSSNSLALAFRRSAMNCTSPRMFALFPDVPRLKKPAAAEVAILKWLLSSPFRPYSLPRPERWLYLQSHQCQKSSRNAMVILSGSQKIDKGGGLRAGLLEVSLETQIKPPRDFSLAHGDPSDNDGGGTASSPESGVCCRRRRCCNWS